MNYKTIYMYSGQGSQFYRMGKEFLKNNRIFRTWMERLDTVVIDLIGESVLKQLYDSGKTIGELFDATLYSHPSIFMVEYSLSQVLLEEGIIPDFLLGSSLGEFCAMSVSGAMDYEKALTMIVRQAQILEKGSDKGGMLAVLSNPELYHEYPEVYGNSALAAINSAYHFIVAGGSDELKEVRAFLKEKNICNQPLPVSYGFHSSQIDFAEKPYKEYLGNTIFQNINIPIISCCYAGRIEKLSTSHLWDIIRKPIQFEKTILHLESIEDKNIYIDLGPSGTMATLVKYNLSDTSNSKFFPILDPFGRDIQNFKNLITNF